MTAAKAFQAFWLQDEAGWILRLFFETAAQGAGMLQEACESTQGHKGG